jgi:hypothetical protein
MERVFAVIEDSKVVNIIVGVEDEVVAANPNKFVEYTDENSAGIGWTYDGTTFEQPPIPVVEEPTNG